MYKRQVMKPALAIALLWSVIAHAQEVTRAEKLRYLEEQVAQTRGTRTLGIALTVGGAVALVAGGAFLVFSVGDYSYQQRATNFGMVSAACLVAGVAAAGIGIVFWVQGANRAGAYEKKRDELMLTVLPLSGGGTLLASWTW